MTTDATPRSQAVRPADLACCQEFERASALSRRRFLQGMAATGTTAVATTMFGDAVRQTAFGLETGGNVLVVVSMRGGLDGLGLVVPHGDPAYYTSRPRIALSRDSLVASDAMFGLHPSMAPLAWLFDAGELAAVHAVGMAQPNRSHFAAMEQIEDADPGSRERRGWINRMIGLNGSSSPVEAVHINDSITPTLLAGPAPSLSTRGLRWIKIPGMDGEWARARRRGLDATWRGATGPLAQAARSAISASDIIAPLGDRTYRPAYPYPDTWPAQQLGEVLQDTAQLIKADVGAQVISVDYGGWDHHANYGTAEWGSMTTMVEGFAKAMNAFLRDLGPIRSRVTVVTISEFGRRVTENGNQGLDHGWGNAMLLMGAGVRGGRYYGTWPWLSAGNLVDGDLAVTTDYRQVLGEVVTRRFPDRTIAQVFPGLSFSPLGVMR